MNVTNIQYKDSSGLNYKAGFILNDLICAVLHHQGICGLRHRISTYWHFI